MLQWKRKQYTFSVTARPALINSPRYEYACSGLVNISYRNINHPFIGNLSAVEDGNRRARTEGATGRKRNILKGWGLKRDVGAGGCESWRDKGMPGVRACACARARQIEIWIGRSVYHSECVLWLFLTRFGNSALISRGEEGVTCVSFSPLPLRRSHTLTVLSPQMKTQRAHSSFAICLSWDKKCLLGLFFFSALLTVFFSSHTLCSWSLR